MYNYSTIDVKIFASSLDIIVRGIYDSVYMTTLENKTYILIFLGEQILSGGDWMNHRNHLGILECSEELRADRGDQRTDRNHHATMVPLTSALEKKRKKHTQTYSDLSTVQATQLLGIKNRQHLGIKRT